MCIQCVYIYMCMYIHNFLLERMRIMRLAFPVISTKLVKSPPEPGCRIQAFVRKTAELFVFRGC